jgi:fructose-1-phosphate kinase PfkB-like protein
LLFAQISHNAPIRNASGQRSTLMWRKRSKATRLQGQGFSIGERKVADLLHQMKYSLQANTTVHSCSILIGPEKPPKFLQ